MSLPELAHPDAFDAFFLSRDPSQWNQVLLLQGAYTPSLHLRVQRLTASILCQNSPKPCHVCQSCRLSKQGTHPDCLNIEPEKKASSLKIEAVRALADRVHLSPQLGRHRVIILHSVERLTTAAANALLKLLEEPPEGVYCILLAAHLSGILPTLLSRCQLWRMQEEDFHYSLMQESIQDEDLAKIWKDRLLIIDNVQDLLQRRLSSYTLASQWSAYDLHALCRMLYWLHAALIAGQCSGHALPAELQPLSGKLTTRVLFSQLDKINAIVRRVHQGIAVNQLLVLEDFLAFSG